MTVSGNCRHIARDLPWYINGTLDEREMVRVERHLDDCAACRHAVATELAVAQRYSRQRATEPLPATDAESGLGELLLALDDPPRGHRQPRYGIAVAACALLSVTAIWLALAPTPEREAAYRTLSRVTPHEQGPVLQLVFHRQASEQAIQETLSAAGATLVSRPTAAGVYRVTLPADATPEQVDGILTRLRGNPQVQLAEREY